jgi:hypothetical protein
MIFERFFGGERPEKGAEEGAEKVEKKKKPKQPKGPNLPKKLQMCTGL